MNVPRAITSTACALLLGGCDAARREAPAGEVSPPPASQAPSTSAAKAGASLPEGARLPSPGAGWTRNRQPSASFIAPPQNMDSDGQLSFYTGFSFFRSPWIAAPASTTARDGLGPLFNAHTCAACHPNGGRGVSLLDKPDAPGTVVRVSVRTPDGEVRPHPRYGSQLQVRATFAGGAEASVRASVQPGSAQLGKENLRAPKLDVRLAQADGERQALDADLLLSARVAPPLLGLGLLEGIPEARVLAAADANDENGDGISGRPQRTASGHLGRFGWKAARATVAEQTAAAFSEDIGITSTLFPDSTCTPLQTACQLQPHGRDAPEDVEIPSRLFDHVVHFVAHIPPPAAGELTPQVRRGRQAFSAIGCDGCHTPSHPSPAGVVWPYTDLLLHDMGEGLADHRPEGEASGREWRTAPLWGIGARVQGAGRNLLHDGRARNVDEAIRWHDGEAANARRAYQGLGKEEQRALLAFLDAI